MAGLFGYVSPRSSVALAPGFALLWVYKMTVLYDIQGRLLFSGGITSARGHEGDSAGLQRISSLLRTGKADRSDAPVYGCSMRHEARTEPAIPKETR